MRWLLCTLLALNACHTKTPAVSPPASQPTKTITPALTEPTERMMQDVAWLSSDAQRGRGSLSQDAKDVASWIAEQWRVSGLEVSLQEIPETEGQVNVIGVRRGSDEVILFGAHYDHLGVIAGQTYFGADDNASGTAVLLALARALSEYQGKTLVFIAFGAEEEGLLGSAAYVQTPLYPLEQTRVMLNFDMVGRDFLEVSQGRPHAFGVIGAEADARFAPILREAARQEQGEALLVGAKLISLLGFERSSDDYHFRQKGVPALFFSTSMHLDYHQPSDTAEKIKPAQLQLIAGVALRFLYAIP